MRPPEYPNIGQPETCLLGFAHRGPNLWLDRCERDAGGNRFHPTKKVAMELIEAEHPRPRHFLLHFSDAHLLGGTDPLHGVVDSDARLRELFDEVRASGARPEAVIFTGDLADRGEAEAYAKIRSIVEPACEAMGAKIIWAMGNHDNRANFRTGLLDEPADGAPVDRSYFLNGLRIITLDTSVPGFHHGELS